MKEIRYEEISKEKATQILEEILEVFSSFSSNFETYELSFPLILGSDDEAKKKVETKNKYTKLKWKDIKKSKLKKVDKKIKSYYDLFNNNIYKITYNNQKYEMRVFDSPKAYGFNSVLENVDENSYLYVDFQKVKSDEQYNVSFGFDKTTVEFLELFEIKYVKEENTICTCECIEEIQKEYEGKKLKK